jgi:hypothetical protein
MLVGTNELAPNFLQQGRLRWNSLLVKAALWIGLLLFLRVRKKIAVLSNHDGNGWSLPSWKDGRTLFLFLVGAGMFRELTGQAAYVWLCHVCLFQAKLSRRDLIFVPWSSTARLVHVPSLAFPGCFPATLPVSVARL